MELKNFMIGACDISKYMFSGTSSTNPALFYTLDSRRVERGEVLMYTVNSTPN